MKTLGFTLTFALFCLIHELAPLELIHGFNKAPVPLGQIEWEKALNSGGFQKYLKTEK